MRTRLLACSALCALVLLTAAASASAWSILPPIFPPAPGGAPWYPGADNYLWYPKGLTFDAGGDGVAPGVWVTDVGHDADKTGPNAVFKFPLAGSPADGTMPSQIIGPVLKYTNGTTAETLYYPGGVAIDPATHNIYITDADSHRIIELNSAGQVLAMSDQSKLAKPHGLQLVNGRLYVADPGSHDIRVVSLDLQTWYETYSSSDFKSGPAMFAVDPSNGRIWAPDEGFRAGETDPGVTASDHGRVVVFNGNDTQADIWTNADFGQLYGAAYDAANGVVYVGDYSKDKILIFNAATGALLDTVPGGTNFVTPVGMSFDPAARILYFGSVGSKNWHDTSTKRTVQRIDFGSAPGPTSGAGGSGGETTATDSHAPTLGHPSWSVHRAHGKISVTGRIPVLDFAHHKLASSLCRGKATTALGRTVTTALRHPLIKRSTKLSAHGGCHVPVSLRMRARPLPKTGHLRIAYAGGGALEAFSASLPVKLR